MGAGVYRAEERSGAMHGKKFLIDEVQYGSDGENVYVRVDFHEEFDTEHYGHGTTPHGAGGG